MELNEIDEKTESKVKELAARNERDERNRLECMGNAFLPALHAEFRAQMFALLTGIFQKVS